MTGMKNNNFVVFFFNQRRIFTYLLELRQDLFPHGRFKTRVTPSFDSASEFAYVFSAVKRLGSFPYWEKCPVHQQRSPTMTHSPCGTRPVPATKSPVYSPNTLPCGSRALGLTLGLQSAFKPDEFFPLTTVLRVLGWLDTFQALAAGIMANASWHNLSTRPHWNQQHLFSLG